MNVTRKKRIYFLMYFATGIAIVIGLALYALKSNINLFYTPSQVMQQEAPNNHTFRVGGMVVKGSVHHDPNQVAVEFLLSDTHEAIKVHFEGILPDLFREGQGIVAEGMWDPKGIFIANTVLAKHDEKYMPPQLKSAMMSQEKNKNVT